MKNYQLIASSIIFLFFLFPFVNAQDDQSYNTDSVQHQPVLNEQKLKSEIEYYNAQVKKLNESPTSLDKALPTIVGFFIAAIILAIGGYITYFFNIKAKDLEKLRIYERQRQAVYLSLVELKHNVSYVLESWEDDDNRPLFFSDELITQQPYTQASNNSNDPYFRKYYLVDTAYLLCSALGWFELYREDLHFLRHNQKSDQEIQKCIENFRRALCPTFEELSKITQLSPIILLEEQRAIGEKMIETKNNQMVIRGYASFSEQLFRLPEKKDMVIKMDEDISRTQDFWIHIVTRFLTYKNYSNAALKDRFNELSTVLNSFILTLTPTGN
ncbi:MAG: hypothetical protein WKF90_12235 [Pyrinomonadaceae bacterium]